MIDHAPRTHDRRAAVVLLALVLATLGFSRAPAQGPFADVPADHLFADSIERLAVSGVTRGCGGERFCPDASVTRGEMAAFLTRALDLPASSTLFRDTLRHLFREDAGSLADAGITRGCGGDRFCPDASVTRGEMAAFLTRTLELPAGRTTFDDTRRHLFAKDIAALADADITRGCGDDRFCPDDHVTRGQMAAFLDRSGLLDPTPSSRPATPASQSKSDQRRTSPPTSDGATPPRQRPEQTPGPEPTVEPETEDANAQRPPRTDRPSEPTPGPAATPTPEPTPEPTPGPSTDPTPVPTPDDEPSRTPNGSFDFARWEAALPTTDEVGRGWTSTPDDHFALRTDRDAHDVRAVGGRGAAVLVTSPDVTVSKALLGGAADGFRQDQNTTLVDSVVTVKYGKEAHADHVQTVGRHGLTLRRVRLIAENEAGATDVGWNAAVFVHGGSTDWRLEDVYVEAGRPELAVTSWYPLRLMSGRGHVDGVVIDRAAMKHDRPVLVGDDVTIVTWRDVYVRELDGSLTPVPRP